MKANGDVFISYQREDEYSASAIRNALRAEGFNVWWDRELQSGDKWEQTIDDALQGTKSILVLWSANSIHSEWVKHEASIGKINNKLIQAKLDSSIIPKPFQAIQSADLSDWDNHENNSQFKSLVRSISVKKKVKHYEKVRKGLTYLLVLLLAGCFGLYFWSDFEKQKVELAKKTKENIELKKEKSNNRNDLVTKLEAYQAQLSNLKAKKKNHQPIFRIENIKVNGGTIGSEIRIIATINDYSISYPTNSIWLKTTNKKNNISTYFFRNENTTVSSNITSNTESFFLPDSSNEYQVSFNGFIKDTNGELHKLVGSGNKTSASNNKYEYKLIYKDKSLTKQLHDISIIYSVGQSSFLDMDIQSAVDKILDMFGLQKNFILKAADVGSAASAVVNGKRYILYNPTFMEKASNDKWSEILILSHEIGHHMNGHTLTHTPVNRVKQELAADKFSGVVLARFGATLDQAMDSLDKLVISNSGSFTHPPKKERLSAIRSGWMSVQ